MALVLILHLKIIYIFLRPMSAFVTMLIAFNRLTTRRYDDGYQQNIQEESHLHCNFQAESSGTGSKKKKTLEKALITGANSH